MTLLACRVPASLHRQLFVRLAVDGMKYSAWVRQLIEAKAAGREISIDGKRLGE
jgi:hypothetical protein